MLLEFKMKNFKSFYDNTTITMMANNAQKEFSERLTNIAKDKNIQRNVIPSLVVYGSNASGKTSIIAAMNTLKQIVISGTIKNEIKNAAIEGLAICPFIHDINKMKEPIHLEIKFNTDKYIYNYSIDIVISFIDHVRKIVGEELNLIDYKKNGSSVKEERTNIFKRTENTVNINNGPKSLRVLQKNNDFGKGIENLEKIFSKNLDKEDLFLTTGFKSMLNLKIENDILKWFQEKLVTIVDFNDKEPLVNFDNDVEDKWRVYTSEKMDKLMKLADFGPQKLAYIKDNNSGKYILNSIYNMQGSRNRVIINSKAIESKGTIKLIDFWITLLDKFKNGGVFVLDEFDSSIHPELVCGIIDLFNNKGINTKHAQLIFNTHNPIYLQKKFFRRDQIMFVEKDEKTYMSTVYKLSEYNLRNDLNYMKSYFQGKFGALPYIDFESALNDEKGAE